MLLQAKADVNAAPAPERDRTALQAAAEGGYVDVIDLLLREKADVNAAPAPKRGRRALQAAAARGHLDVINLLLQEKADVNAFCANDGGDTAIEAAAWWSGDSVVMDRLIEAGAKVDVTGEKIKNSMCEAAEKGNLATVNLLLSLGVSPEAKRWNGSTAPQLAVKGGHRDVIQKLELAKRKR